MVIKDFEFQWFAPVRLDAMSDEEVCAHARRISAIAWTRQREEWVETLREKKRQKVEDAKSRNHSSLGHTSVRNRS